MVRRFGLAEGEQAPEDLDPRRCLLRELWRTVRLVDQLEAEVARLAEVHGPMFHVSGIATGERRPHVVWQMWQDQRSHLRAVAESCHRAGVEDFRVGLEAAHAEVIAGLIRGVVAELGLAAEQRDRALAIAGRHLRELGEGSDGHCDR